MGNAAAFYQGAKWYDDYQNQARQSKADAWALQQQDRTKKDWEKQDQTRAGLDSMIDQVAGSTPNAPIDPRTALGLGDAMPEPSVYAQRQGFESPVGADVPTPGLATPQKNSPFYDAQVKTHQQRLAMAKALGGKDGAVLALDTGELMKKSRLAEESTQIAETIQSLGPKDYKKLMETVTADSGNKYEATVDPETGITTLKLGDSKAQLTRAQAGQYFAAKHRLKEGDPTALADLEKIDAGLAAKVMAEYKSLRDTANDSNKATYQSGLLDVREKAVEARERGGGSGSIGREERLRYTSLFSDAGRRAGEVQRTISSLQRDPDFATGLRRNPNGPQAQQLKDLNESLAGYLEERKTYQGLLSDSQTGGTQPKPGLGTPLAPTEKAMREQASGDMGANPESADREIAATMQDINNPKTNPQDRQNAVAYLADLRRQKANMGLANQTSAPSTAKAGIAKPTNAAEHAALPKGAKYMAPNGQLYVKQ